MRKSYDFLAVCLSLLLSPSIAPLEIMFWARKPIQKKLAMSPQHAGNFLHRLDAGAHHLGAPGVAKFAGPVGGNVL